MKNSLKGCFVFLVLVLGLMMPAPSYAWHHDYVVVGWSGPYYNPYYYGYAPYYNPYAYPYGYPPAYPAEVVTSGYQPVVVNGTTYYLNNGVYYTYTQYGYQAVPTPAGISAPAVTSVSTPSAENSTTAVSDDTVSVNIPNKNGGYTTVILKRSGNGFTGPQGEFYAEFPKVSQLEVVYGK